MPEGSAPNRRMHKLIADAASLDSDSEVVRIVAGAMCGWSKPAVRSAVVVVRRGRHPKGKIPKGSSIETVARRAGVDKRKSAVKRSDLPGGSAPNGRLQKLRADAVHFHNDSEVV